MNLTKSDLSVQIIDYEDRLAPDFARLNYEWLEAYFDVEPQDRKMLDAPYDNIIKPGGRIFFAKINGEIVGTAALVVEDDETFELAKMGVTPKYRGLKIGKKLMLHAIDEARKSGKKRLLLESNTKLTAAVNLYTHVGFKVVPTRDRPYTRCNISMELKL